MKLWTVAAGIFVVATLAIGCHATRYEVLSFFFDGVPPPKAAVPEGQVAAPPDSARSRQVGYREHGPYAAKMCSACHEPGALQALVLPADQLCFKCHDFTLDKKHIHGPLASGGCTACHDPHSSQYRYLLVSESDSFCTHCHDPHAMETIGAHRGIEAQCTACHDAHMSDKKYLLK